MTALEEILRTRIAADGPMLIEDWMAACLGDPEHGYYMTQGAIGAGGDFTTAPEISQMFGEIVGAWLAHAWELAGRPDPVMLVEFGPGWGTLMADVLRVMRRLPGLPDALDVHLVETSPRLRAVQRESLDDSYVKVTWHDDLAQVPDAPMLLVGNEFFDALPIRQIVRREDGWRERRVGIEDEGFTFVDGNLIETPPGFADAAPGEIAESSPASLALAEAIGRRLARRPGAAVVVDYGYRAPATGDSLQALRHGRPADPLEAPGEADLTAHVDFAGLAGALRKGGAAVHGPATQGSFLTALGIGLRAERLRAAGAAAGDLGLALERLTGAAGMGSLFKVLAATSPGMATPPPFDLGAA